jgi:NitT/TauT family transport system substrate-binding protein
MAKSVRVRVASVALAALTVLSTTGCGLLASAPKGPQTVVGNPRDLETVDIVVTTLPTLDVAPIYIAVKKGYFGREGLNVTLLPVASGGAAIDSLVAGRASIAFGSYTPFFAAQERGVARNVGGLKLVADASSLGPGNSEIVVAKDSPIRNVRDLRGAKIGIVAVNSMTQYLTASSLDANDVPLDSVTWVPLPFPDTGPQVASGGLDAAFLTEPVLTIAKAQFGVRRLADTNTGSTEGLPLTGYGATGVFVEQNPHTVAAFQRAMQRATLDARDPRVITPVAQESLRLNDMVAKVMKLPQYQAGLLPGQLQRTADLMVTLGGLAAQLDVKTMIVKPAPLTK